MDNRRREILGHNYIRERARRAVRAEFEAVFRAIEPQHIADAQPAQPAQLLYEEFGDDPAPQPGEAFGDDAPPDLADDDQQSDSDNRSDSSNGSNADEQSDSDGEAEDPFQKSLRDWAVQYKVPLVALDSLLKVLHPRHPTLPKCAKTLLRTPRDTPPFKQLANGKYCHFGLKKGLLSKGAQGVKPNTEIISLDIFVDAVKIYDTASHKCTAILCRSSEFIDKRPFPVGLFYGDGDPIPVEEFLDDYIEEVLVLLADGITVMDRHFPLRIRRYIADALGRAYLKGIISHTARHGCERCPQVGPSHDNVNVGKSGQPKANGCKVGAP
ncbi:Halomucin [Frankliniella fusca]|uniref:Halomucin n=1 Tax=Frankliniella fusca TaxID=407009 RepID=A0AAE1HVI8_9NEOP|nr:Halomucin [Frankliniella fusca]